VGLVPTAPTIIQIANAANTVINPLDITTFTTATVKVIVTSGTISAGTVNVGNVATVTGTVSVSGTPTVSIVGTVPVTVAAVATVTGTVSVSGTVPVTLAAVATVTGTVSVSAGTISIGGEKYTRIAALGTTTITGVVLDRVSVNTLPAAAGTVVVFDGLVAGGTVIASITPSTTGNPFTLQYGATILNGSVQVVVSGSAPDLTAITR